MHCVYPVVSGVDKILLFMQLALMNRNHFLWQTIFTPPVFYILTFSKYRGSNAIIIYIDLNDGLLAAAKLRSATS